MTILRADLDTLPTETLVALAILTGELRAAQHLRALTPDMLRALRLECERRQNTGLSAMVCAELDGRGERK